MDEPIKELKFMVKASQARGQREPTYTYSCPNVVEIGQKINELVRAVNQQSTKGE